MIYAFAGTYDDYPAKRTALEAAGIVIVATTTVDDVLQVETGGAIPEALLDQLTLQEA